MTLHSDKSCLVAIATYNEIENLPALVDQVLDVVDHVDVLIVDDNSPDGTGRWAEQRAATDDHVHCIVRPGKLGLGTASIACLRYAIEHQFDWLLTMDADFSHHPQYLPDLLQAMEESSGTDVVIGSRYVPGGRVEGWPWYRHLMSRAINGYARTLLRIPARDCSGAFRCYRVEKLNELQLDQLQSRGYSVLEELLWQLTRLGARIKEVPIVFVDREAGSSKINFRESLASVGSLLWLALRSNRSKRGTP